MREVLSSLVDIYLSNASIKMNEIMKVLTIISTIFIPLTFIVGLYGMNFKYMPEINWIYGYPSVLVLMLSVALGLIIYFKRKKWF
jgi:magnesium transporter